MTIQQLNYVIRISETGSFNRAAEKLFVAQPSLTSAVKDEFAAFEARRCNWRRRRDCRRNARNQCKH